MLGLAAAALGYIALYTLVLHPMFAPAQGSFELHFGKWGTTAAGALLHIVRHPGELLAHLVAPRRLLYPWLVLGPLALLPLASPRWLLPALPVLAVNLLSDFPTTTNLDSHYLTPAVPFLVAGALDGAAVLGRRAITAWGPTALLLAATVAHLIAGGTPLAFDCPWVRFLPDARTPASRAVLAAIRPGDVVQAPYELLPHLAERPSLFRSPPPIRGADVLVLDASHRRRFAHREDLLRTVEEPRFRAWLAADDRGLVAAAGDYLVLRSGASPRGGPAARYIVGRADPRAGVGLTRCLAVRGARLDSAGIVLDLVARGSCPSDLAVRLGVAARPRRVDLLFDGRLSPAHLRAGDHLLSRHAMSSDSLAELVARGTVRVGLLRSSGARPEHEDPVAVDVPLR